MNPEEMGEYGEGDILIPRGPYARNGVREQAMLWTSGHIPYKIEGHFSKFQKLTNTLNSRN